MHPMSEYARRGNLPSDLDQRRHVALARDVGLGRIATLTEPWGRLARFWAEALGYRLEEPPAGFDSWQAYWVSRGLPEEELEDG
jgi:hypothetical protein